MSNLIVYCGLNGVEAIKNRKTKKIIFIGNRKSKIGLKTYPKSKS